MADRACSTIRRARAVAFDFALIFVPSIAKLEDRFVDALKEESKVDRHTSGRDGMVHLGGSKALYVTAHIAHIASTFPVIYLLDPRSILAPSRPIASAWSGEDKVVYDFAKANETYDTTPTWSPHVRHAEIQAVSLTLIQMPYTKS